MPPCQFAPVLLKPPRTARGRESGPRSRVCKSIQQSKMEEADYSCHMHPETNACGRTQQLGMQSLVPKHKEDEGDRGSPAEEASSRGPAPKPASAAGPRVAPNLYHGGDKKKLDLFLAKELDILSYFPVLKKIYDFIVVGFFKHQ